MVAVKPKVEVGQFFEENQFIVDAKPNLDGICNGVSQSSYRANIPVSSGFTPLSFSMNLRERVATTIALTSVLFVVQNDGKSTHRQGVSKYNR